MAKDELVTIATKVEQALTLIGSFPFKATIVGLTEKRKKELTWKQTVVRVLKEKRDA